MKLKPKAAQLETDVLADTMAMWSPSHKWPLPTLRVPGKLAFKVRLTMHIFHPVH